MISLLTSYKKSSLSINFKLKYKSSLNLNVYAIKFLKIKKKNNNNTLYYIRFTDSVRYARSLYHI